MSTNATYALIGIEKNNDFVLFIGNGTELIANGITILSKEKGNVVLEKKEGKLFLNNEVPVVIKIGNKEKSFKLGNYRTITIN